MSAARKLGPWNKLPRRNPTLLVADAKPGDRVICTDGRGTGFLRRGREYVLAHITPSGYVRVDGSEDYYHPGRFNAATVSAAGSAS